MSKKSLLKIFFIILAIIANVIVIWRYKKGFAEFETVTLKFSIESAVEGNSQLYYCGKEEDFSEDKSIKTALTKGANEISFELPFDCEVIRLDPVDYPGQVELKNIKIGADSFEEEVAAADFVGMTKDNVNAEISADSGTVVIDSANDDPYFLVNIDRDQLKKDYEQSVGQKNLIISIVLCIIIDLIVLYVLKHFNAIVEVPSEIFRDRKIALTLAKNDFKTKYAGSYLGIVWAFIQPVTTILVYWFVFQVGFRSGSVKGYPFVLYLVSGIVPWFYFSDALNGGTAALTEYSYLVKKVVFNIDILPFIKVVSAIFVHFFFIIFAIILGCLSGFTPTLHMLQLLYYIGCSFIFTLGLTYLTSAIVVFFRDLSQFINIFVLQVGMWLTPIMWDENMLPKVLITVFKLNPMFYVVDGFRDSMIYHKWVWEGKALWTIYFWVITILVFGLGTKVFRRLKVHFADVL